MDLELLERMIRFNAVVGNEHGLAAWLAEQARPHATRVEVDRLGNLFAWRGEQPRVALFGHLDSVGFIVEAVRDDHLKVLKLGHPDTPPYAPVVVELGSGEELRGTLLVEEETLLVDLWEPARADTVQVGDVVSFAPNFRADETFIHSRWLDNKLGTWVAFEAWRQAESAIFVATVREEQSPAGAGAAARHLPELELGVVVDITYSASPQGPYLVEWGQGPAVTFRDALAHDRRWARAMLDVARAAEIAAQPEVARSGGSDVGPLLSAGVPALFVGVPIRYAHSPAEVARLSDADAARALLLRFLERYPTGRLGAPA